MLGFAWDPVFAASQQICQNVAGTSGSFFLRTLEFGLLLCAGANCFEVSSLVMLSYDGQRMSQKQHEALADDGGPEDSFAWPWVDASDAVCGGDLSPMSARPQVALPPVKAVKSLCCILCCVFLSVTGVFQPKEQQAGAEGGEEGRAS